ncbi:MAG: hypothetical protein LBI68_08500 [Azoarcus sp.]|jgi:hypothetical protein|nr:hypothetical protein [Azoarcus sp.]
MAFYAFPAFPYSLPAGYFFSPPPYVVAPYVAPYVAPAYVSYEGWGLPYIPIPPIYTSRDVLHGSGDPDILNGDNRPNIINGRSGDDILNGNGGDDILYGESGDDTLYGGLGNDSLHGDTGNDTLYGGPGNDLLYGFVGDDILYGDTGNDILYGGTGSDTYIFDLGSGHDEVVDTMSDLDIIQFGDGIAPEDIAVDQFGDTTILIFNGGYDSVTYNTIGIEEVHFANGTVWTPGDIAAMI